MNLVSQWFASFLCRLSSVSLLSFTFFSLHFISGFAGEVKGAVKTYILSPMLTTEKNCYLHVGQYRLICFTKLKK